MSKTEPLNTDASPTPGGNRAAFLVTGFFTLTLVSFLDNVRGPILPLLCSKLAIPYETAGQFLTIGCLTAVMSTLLLSPALRKWGERKVTASACVIATLPGLFAPLVSDRVTLLILGGLLGMAVALIGSLCNILTMLGSTPKNRSRTIAFQHVMYGIGSMSAPFLFRELVTHGSEWWRLLQFASLAFFVLAFQSFFTLPKTPASHVREVKPQHATLDRSAALTIVMFAMYVAGEVLASMWMSSLMVSAQGKTAAEAANYLMGFFVILALTRFLCFAFLKPRWEHKVIWVSLLAATIFALLGQQGHSWALSAIGVLGPFFPLAISRMSLRFPDSWQRMTIYVYSGIQTMLALMHLTVGRLADALDMSQAFLLAPFFLGIALMLYRSSPLSRNASRHGPSWDA